MSDAADGLAKPAKPPSAGACRRLRSPLAGWSKMRYRLLRSIGGRTRSIIVAFLVSLLLVPAAFAQFRDGGHTVLLQHPEQGSQIIFMGPRGQHPRSYHRRGGSGCSPRWRRRQCGRAVQNVSRSERQSIYGLCPINTLSAGTTSGEWQLRSRCRASTDTWCLSGECQR